MPNPSNSDLVGEARRLSEAATPGPWRVKHEVVGTDTTPHRVIAFQLGRYRDARREVASCDGSIAGQDDAEFIARARTLLPELAQQLDAYELVVEQKDLWARSEQGRAEELAQQLEQAEQRERRLRILAERWAKDSPIDWAGDVARSCATELLGALTPDEADEEV